MPVPEPHSAGDARAGRPTRRVVGQAPSTRLTRVLDALSGTLLWRPRVVPASRASSFNYKLVCMFRSVEFHLIEFPEHNHALRRSANCPAQPGRAVAAARSAGGTSEASGGEAPRARRASQPPYLSRRRSLIVKNYCMTCSISTAFF